jgi:hypothetical protein
VKTRQLYDCGLFQCSIDEIRKFIHPLINRFGIDHRQNNTVTGYHAGGQPAFIFETDHCIRQQRKIPRFDDRSRLAMILFR